MRRRAVRLYGGPAHGRMTLELLGDNTPVPVTLTVPDAHDDALSLIYEYAGGGVYLYVGDHEHGYDPDADTSDDWKEV